MFLPKRYNPNDSFDGSLKLLGFRVQGIAYHGVPHVEGRVWASDYTEFINSVHHNLLINGYDHWRTFEWWIIRE